jgi:hypothetical protein
VSLLPRRRWFAVATRLDRMRTFGVPLDVS